MDNQVFSFFIEAFTSLLAILNPIGVLPIYLSLKNSSFDLPRRTIFTTSAAVFTILLLFTVFGQSILSFFGIGLPAFRIGGGLMILSIAFSMLHGQMSPAKHTPEETPKIDEMHSIAVVPLAIPILSGPGSISTIILLSQKIQSPMMMGALFLAISINSILIYLILSFSDKVNALLGITGVKIFSRIMGMILIAIAVQFILDGLAEVSPFIQSAHPVSGIETGE